MAEMTLNPITEHGNGKMLLTALDDPWDLAVDCVNYPVYIKPLYFVHPDQDDPEAEEYLAIGETNTGRECQFFGVVVDRDRTGELSTISTVTGMYDTMPAAEVYLSLREDLEAEGITAKPHEVYVSGNGGKHQLRVVIDGLDWTEGNMEMSLVLNTSVDGKTKHQIHLAPIDKASGHEIVGLSSAMFNVSARHTKSLREHHASFSLLIQKLVEEWNTTIMPTMVLMNDCKFDKDFALDILKQLSEASGLPALHADRVVEYYTRSTNKEHNLFGVFRGMSEYLGEELDDKPERLITFKEKLAKRSANIIQDTFKKMRKA